MKKKLLIKQFFILTILVALVSSFNAFAQDKSTGQIPESIIDRINAQNNIDGYKTNIPYTYNGNNVLASQGFAYGAQDGLMHDIMLPSGTVGNLPPFVLPPNSYASGMTRDGTGASNSYWIINTGDSVFQFDDGSGLVTYWGTFTVPVGANGIAYNPVDGMFYLATSTDLWVLSSMTLPMTPTLVGPFGAGGLMIDLCFANDGTCYAYDLISAAAYTVNSATGSATLLGSIGYSPNFGQGMGYDYETGWIYLTAFNYGAFDGELRVMDPETGYTNFLASFGLNQYDCFSPQTNPLLPLVGPGRATAPTHVNGAVEVLISSGTLTWTNPGTATTNEVWFGTDPHSLSSVSSGTTLETSYGATLAYATTYYWKVDETSGGNTTPGTLWSFTTEAAPLPIPWVEDFNASTTLPDGWLTDAYWYISSVHGTNGTNGLYKNLWSGTTTGVARTPFVGQATSSTVFEFDYRITNYTGGGATTLNEDSIDIQISTDNVNWTTIYTIDVVTHIPSTSFVKKSFDMSSYSGNYVHARFNCKYGFGADSTNDYYVELDNVYIGLPPPGSFTATTISETQIDLAFTTNPSSDNVVIVWNSDGVFTDPSGAPPAVGNPFAGGTLLYDGISSPVNHTGLTHTTLYYYKAFSYDGSEYSMGLEDDATTPSPPITTFPYETDFEGSFPPPGYSNYGDKLWTLSTSGGVGGSQCARVSYSPAGTANLQTPDVVIPASPDHRITFWWKDHDISSQPMIEGYDTTYFEITTNGGTTWIGLDTLSAASSMSDFVQEEHDLSSYAGETVSFRWRDVVDPAASWNAYGTGLDDIIVEETPVGPVFSISPDTYDYGSVFVGNTVSQDFTITNTGGGTLTISTGGITLIGSNPGEFTLGTIGYPIELAALESEVISVSFTPTSQGTQSATLQIVDDITDATHTVPLTGYAIPAGIVWEDFTGTTFPPPGWLSVNNDGGTKTWLRNTGKFNSSPASASSSWESGTIQNNDWLITPKLSVVTGDSLTFWHSIGSTTYPESMVIKVGATNDPNGVWTDLDSLLDNTLDWKYESYDLTAYNGQNVYIAFVNRSFDKLTLYLDDILGPLVYVDPNDIGVTAFAQPTTESVVVPTGISRDYVEKDPALANKLQKVSISFSKVETNNSPDAPIDFEVIVQNFGGLAQASYQIGWEIDGIMQTPVNNTETLDPGEVDTLTITWAAPVAGVHTSRAWTILAGDTNPSNDTSGTISFYAVPDNSVFLEGFEDAIFPPTGWLTVNRDGGGLSGPWFQGNPAVFSALTGNGYAGDNFNSANGLYIDDYLITPNTGGSSTDVDSLVFWMRAPDASAWPDSVEIRVSTTGTDTADFTILLDYIVVPLTWTRFAYELPNAADRYIAFRYLIYDAATNSNYIGLDLVEIQRHSSGTTFSLDVDVVAGWNMVSVPGLHPIDQLVDTWWSNQTGSVFKFGGGYVAVDTAETGEGYWMKNPVPETYSYPAIDIVTHDTISAASGWNMIGGYEDIILKSGLTTDPSGLITGSVFGYSGGYNAVDSLVPGYGYWIKLTASGGIIIPGPAPLSKVSADVVEYIQEDWGKITITDNAGRRYTLYAVNGEVDLNQYELPPMPPEGMFDIRYGSGRIAEDINTSIQSIDMSGIEYPLTVKVENIDIRLKDVTGNEINENVKSGEEVTISNTSINKLMVTGELIPDVYALEQNYPNPFNPSTVIEFSLPEDVSNVQLTIYDILGQRITQLVNTSLKAGYYKYQWNGGTVATGMYIYELRTDKFVSVKKMMLLK